MGGRYTLRTGLWEDWYTLKVKVWKRKSLGRTVHNQDGAWGDGTLRAGRRCEGKVCLFSAFLSFVIIDVVVNHHNSGCGGGCKFTMFPPPVIMT